MYLAMSISGWITTIVPKVDKQFVEFFPQYANCEGDILRHHHVGGGGQTYAIPSTLHPRYGGVHNYEKKAGVTGNDYLTNRAQSFENIKNKNICYKKG